MPWTRTFVCGVMKIAMEITLVTGLLADCLNDLSGSVGHGIARDDGEARLAERFLAGEHIIALEAHDQGKLETGFADGFDDASGDHVAIHDAAEDVHQDS